LWLAALWQSRSLSRIGGSGFRFKAGTPILTPETRNHSLLPVFRCRVSVV
jgi:hypothetical protein